MHADKHWILSFRVSVTRHGQSTWKKVAYLCNISIKVEFLSADKHKSILQEGGITLGEISPTDPKYQKQSVYNIFAISQWKHEGRSWFFACWQMLNIFSNWCYHFSCVWLGTSKLPKITSLLLLYNMLRMKLVMQLIFYMQISMKTCAKLVLRFFDGYGQAFPKFPEKQVCYFFTISLKSQRWRWLFWCR